MAKSSSTKSQSDKFKEAARELGADTDEESFDRALAKIAPVKDADKKILCYKKG